jgi:hypothetical protein
VVDEFLRLDFLKARPLGSSLPIKLALKISSADESARSASRAALMRGSGLYLIYSSRSNIAGSTDSARCAGIHVARSPTNAIARTTPANTRGSRGVA